jgi:hypothetical protein
MIKKAKTIRSPIRSESNQPLLVPKGNDYREHNFRPVKSRQESRTKSTEASILTIVNTVKSGKRITFAGEVIDQIGSPSTVQIAFNEEGIAISQELPENETCFALRKSGKKFALYSNQLVEEVTTIFELDFSNKSSISFYDVQYLNISDEPVAFVVLRKKEQMVATELGQQEQETEEVEPSSDDEGE